MKHKPRHQPQPPPRASHSPPSSSAQRSTGATPTLCSLPPAVLTTIASLALSPPVPITPLELLTVSKTVHSAALSALVGSLVLEDDDALLVDAERAIREPSARTKLAAILRDEPLASKVIELNVVPRTKRSGSGSGSVELVSRRRPSGAPP